MPVHFICEGDYFFNFRPRAWPHQCENDFPIVRNNVPYGTKDFQTRTPQVKRIVQLLNQFGPTVFLRSGL